VNQIITIAIQMAAPAIVSILMAEMFLGIANRLAPQVQIAFLGMSIKSLLGLSLLWAAWFFILKQFTKQAYNWLDLVNKLIYTLKGLNPLT
jgi:type III secretory pathway component EscT